MLMRNAYFHTIVGMEHIHGYQLMVYRVCEAFQKCIPRENIKVCIIDDAVHMISSYALYTMYSTLHI